MQTHVRVFMLPEVKEAGLRCPKVRTHTATKTNAREVYLPADLDVRSKVCARAVRMHNTTTLVGLVTEKRRSLQSIAIA